MEFDIQLTCTTEPLRPCLSHSLHAYIEDMKYLLQEKEAAVFRSLVNIYDFVYHKVPPTKLSVSKLKPYSQTFYVFMEMMQMFNLLDIFENQNIRTLHYGKNAASVIEYLNMLREDSDDIHESFPEVGDIHDLYNVNCAECLSYEMDASQYVDSFRKVLAHLLKSQCSHGVAIIHIQDIFYRPIVEILFVLTTLYEKVYIIKPNNSDILESDRYIVCKNFILNNKRFALYDRYVQQLMQPLTPGTQLSSLLRNELPYYFLCKIEESNIIIGHQQLESLHQLLSLYRNKNREDKIESIKKGNIQKCIQWCEKFKIPYNKFTDKINIFLSATEE
jgi:hypothetical protein